MKPERTFLRITRSADRGQIIPIMALSLIALIGAAALTIDVGYWRYQQRLAQSAADGAAIAGAGELAYPTSNDMTAAAQKDATANGFTDGTGGVTVVVNNPPLSGTHMSSSSVEVIVTKPMPSFFAGIANINAQQVSARAVASLNTTQLACVIALNGDITLKGGGGGGITAPTCGLVTDKSMTITGQAYVDAAYLGYLNNGPGGGSYAGAAPQQMAAPVQDPCLSMVYGTGVNAVYPCKNLTNLVLPPTNCLDAAGQPPNPLPPGEYCHPLSGTIQFQATSTNSLFILDQGIDVAGNNTVTQTGNYGVTLYSGGDFKVGSSTTFSGNTSVTLSAPTSGPYAGMLYFQPASNTGGITINGTSGTDTFGGGIYAPTADFTFNANIASVTMLIAKSVQMNGGGMGASNVNAFQSAGHAVLSE